VLDGRFFPTPCFSLPPTVSFLICLDSKQMLLFPRLFPPVSRDGTSCSFPPVQAMFRPKSVNNTHLDFCSRQFWSLSWRFFLSRAYPTFHCDSFPPPAPLLPPPASRFFFFRLASPSLVRHCEWPAFAFCFGSSSPAPVLPYDQPTTFCTPL